MRCRKTASTSLEIALSCHVDESDVLTPLGERDEKLRYELTGEKAKNYAHLGLTNHSPALEAKSKLGDDIWQNYFIFCFERNPFDKIVSLYFHRHKGPERPTIDEFIDSGEYLDARNMPLYTDQDNKLMVKQVYQYEQLEESLNDLRSRIALGSLPNAKAQFRPRQSHHRDVLKPRHIDVISKNFALELELGDYQF